MLERKALKFLNEWHLKTQKKPLIIHGPRQIGKTYAVRAFAAQTYESCYEINFLENADATQIFNGSLNADTILTGIRLNYPEVRFNEGNTLIFLDEIQACPAAVTALKFLAADSRFDVIATGSALGMLHGSLPSWPVGQIEYLDMSSLDFEEFLWALGIEKDLTEHMRVYADGTHKIPDAIHTKLMQCLRQYLVIGGMPDVVNAFVDGQNYEVADQVQRRIYRDYVADIAHFAEPENRIKAQKCWQSIPLQLSKENHKFQYETVEHKGTARKFGTAVDWLTASGMATCIYNVSAIEYPLNAFAKQDQFRIYPADIGLLICTYDFSLKRALLMTSQEPGKVESIAVQTAKGGIYEALAADILSKRGLGPLHFFRNTSGTVEIEFLMEDSSGVVPLEIKAGHNRSRSLDTVLQDERISKGYKFADQNAGVDSKRITLPLYMLMFF